MSTYNGQKYIKQQLDSIISQKDVPIILLIRDDGSQDGTVQIIKEYSDKYSNIIIPSELQGYHAKSIAASFFQLLRFAVNTYKDINYFGFADQDDVWYPNKVFRAVNELKKSSNASALYFSKKTIVNEDLQEIRKDPLVFNNNFTDFLSPNDASGCTMVFTRKFAEIVLTGNVETYPNIHDVICTKIALSTDTEIIYDSKFESMLYRIHGNNASGGDRNLNLITTKNIKKLFRKRRHYMKLIATNILADYSEYINDEIKEKLNMVINYTNPVNSIKLMHMYMDEPNRNWKDKLHFSMMVILRGI